MIFAVVPVKTLREAKSRLGPVLSEADRAALAEKMMRGVLLALAESGAVTASAVVSPDPRALEIAWSAGAVPLREEASGLNAALEQARRWALAGGATALLVLLADLPLLRGAEIAALTALAEGPCPCVVLAPDRHGRGTNALLLRPPAAIPFSFGPDSYARHCAAALATGITPAVYRSPGTAFDLDTPSDLADCGLRIAECGVD
ncbi:MAG: 2-phospho-L-lactate guanylyltransferase [Chloroflexia bacterium]